MNTNDTRFGFAMEDDDDGLPASEFAGIEVAAATEPEDTLSQMSRIIHNAERQARQALQAAEDAADAAFEAYRKSEDDGARAAWRSAENRASDARFEWARAESALRRAAKDLGRYI